MVVEVTQGDVTRSATAAVTLEPGPLDSATIEPTGETVEVAGTALDRFGNPIPALVLTYRSDERQEMWMPRGDSPLVLWLAAMTMP